MIRLFPVQHRLLYYQPYPTITLQCSKFGWIHTVVIEATTDALGLSFPMKLNTVQVSKAIDN